MKIENSSFVSFDKSIDGLLFDDSKNEKYPIRYYNVISGFVGDTEGVSYLGFVYSGSVSVLNNRNNTKHELVSGMYFSISGHFQLCGDGKAILIEVLHDQGEYPSTNYRAVDLIGGKIEEKGRLRYIDGCTDSLLIPPVKLGYPCLNHLHFPSGIDQTAHTHPSHRIGIVHSGNGLCKTPFGNVPLTPQTIFIIKAWDGVSTDTGIDGKTYPNGTHSFQTFDNVMNVIAFHPDSDFGATDINHPMINRTIVDGKSASQIDSIRTK